MTAANTVMPLMDKATSSFESNFGAIVKGSFDNWNEANDEWKCVQLTNLFKGGKRIPGKEKGINKMR